MPAIGKRKAPAPRQLTKKEILLSQLARTPTEVNEEDIGDAIREAKIDGGKGVFSHTHNRNVIMFKRDEFGRIARRPVPASNLQMNLENGWLWECPDCGTDCYDDPNACTGREPKKYRECPICAKRFYDPGTIEHLRLYDTDDDDLVIKDDDLLDNTPAMRTLLLLEKHMMAYHPAETTLRANRVKTS